MGEAHSGVCGAHQSRPKLFNHIKIMGYYWDTMVHDCIDLTKRCDACQFLTNFIHQPSEPLHPTVASWPFEARGLDVVGSLTPKSSVGHLYILAATNYFSKWAEALSRKRALSTSSGHTSSTDMVCLDRYIITDNGKPFFNKLMTSLSEKFKFAQHKSSMYHPPANCLEEAFNSATYRRRWWQNPSGTGMKDLKKRFGLIELPIRRQRSQPLTPFYMV